MLQGYKFQSKTVAAFYRHTSSVAVAQILLHGWYITALDLKLA